jgi:hypothetical protein
MILKKYTDRHLKCAGPSDRSPAATVGSNPTGGMDVCLLSLLCVVRLICFRLLAILVTSSLVGDSWDRTGPSYYT